MMNMKKYMLAILCLFCVLALYFINFTIQNPFIGIYIDQKIDGKWEVTKVLPNGWGEAYYLKKGDEIITINGRNPGEYETVKRLGTVEKAESMIIVDNNVKKEYFIENIPKQLVVHIFIPIVVALFVIILSIFLLRTSVHDKSSLILLIFLMSFTIAYIAGFASQRTNIFAQYTVSALFPLLPILLLHYANLYFSRYKIKLTSRKIIMFFYIMIGIILFVLMPLEDYRKIVRILILFWIVSSISFSAFIFIKAIIKYRQTPYQPIFKFMMIGIIGSFGPMVLLTAIPKMIFDDPVLPAEISVIFILFLPITFIHLATSKRLLDINYYTSEWLRGVSISLIPSIVLSLIIAFIYSDFSVVKFFQSTFLFMILTSLLFINSDLKRFLFNKESLSAEMKKFVYAISKAMNKDDLERIYLQQIRDLLGVQRTAIVEYEKGKNKLILRKGEHVYNSSKLIGKIQSQSNLQIGDYYSIDEGVFVVFEKTVNKVFLVYICDKDNFTSFNNQEKSLLINSSYYISISYQNMQLVDELIGKVEKLKENHAASPILSRFLFNLQEKERRRLAIDLHDTVLQDQLVLYRSLEDLVKRQKEDESIDKLVMIRKGMKDIIDKIRETCHELRPPFLREMGIVKALSHLFEVFQADNSIIVQFENRLFYEQIDEEYEIVLYRIVQELLANASKHSKASVISFELSAITGTIFLVYKDNGVGLQVEKTKELQHHTGISGIKERVYSLEGKIELYSSAETNGLEVLIEIPFKNI